MRGLLTSIAVWCGIMAICMGAGPSDFRFGAIMFALFAGIFIGLRDEIYS